MMSACRINSAVEDNSLTELPLGLFDSLTALSHLYVPERERKNKKLQAGFPIVDSGEVTEIIRILERVNNRIQSWHTEMTARLQCLDICALTYISVL